MDCSSSYEFRIPQTANSQLLCTDLFSLDREINSSSTRIMLEFPRVDALLEVFVQD